MTGATRATEPARPSFASCACGVPHTKGRFAELGPVRVLDAEALEDVVVRWPPGVVIDVRLCDRCGGTVARLAERR